MSLNMTATVGSVAETQCGDLSAVYSAIGKENAGSMAAMVSPSAESPETQDTLLASAASATTSFPGSSPTWPPWRERERPSSGLVTCLDGKEKFLGGVSSIEPFVALCFCLSQNKAVTIERFVFAKRHVL